MAKPLETLRKLSGNNAYDYIHEDRFVDRGVDSVGYKVKDVFLQFFGRTPVRKVKLLRSVTDQIADRLNGKTRRIGLFGTVTYRVATIRKLVVTDTNEAVTAKEYVGGHRPKEHEIRPLDHALRKESADLNNQLGVTGIELFAPNVKLQKVRGIGPWSHYTCTITDPVRYLHTLEKKHTTPKR